MMTTTIQRTTTAVDHWRQLDIVTPNQLADNPVTLIGAGGIGSPTAEALVKMGVERLTVYDHDNVESHNLPNQLYGLSDIGQLKVQALQARCLEMSGTEITTIPERYISQSLNGIVICAVDTMQARIDIWKSVQYNPNIRLYIDARMGAEVTRIHTVRPCDLDEIARYESRLYTDENAEEEPCTARAIIYTVYNTAAIIANIVKRIAKGDPIPVDLCFDFVNLLLIRDPLDPRR